MALRTDDDESRARSASEVIESQIHLWNAGNTVQRANVNDLASDNGLWTVGDENGLNNNGKGLELLLANRPRARLFPIGHRALLRPRARKTSCQAMRVECLGHQQLSRSNASKLRWATNALYP